MPVPNPEYNPNWKDIHDHHSAEQKRLSDIISDGYKNDRYDDVFQEAFEQEKIHHAATLDSFRMQHPTIQEYAEWVFENFKPEIVSGRGTSVQIPDFEKFTSMDDVGKAYSHVLDMAKQELAEKERSMPVGQPNDFDAFNIADKDNIFSYWRHFDEAELNSGYGGRGINTLMTIHQVDNQNHICFMHDRNHNGLSVTNGIEKLADVIYREALDIAQKQAAENPKPIGFIKGLLSVFSTVNDSKLPKPEDFRFYTHVPPTAGSFGREEFSEILMSHQNGSFRDPKWIRHKTIPAIIQSARFDVMKEQELSVLRALPKPGRLDY